MLSNGQLFESHSNFIDRIPSTVIQMVDSEIMYHAWITPHIRFAPVPLAFSQAHYICRFEDPRYGHLEIM